MSSLEIDRAGGFNVGEKENGIKRKTTLEKKQIGSTNGEKRERTREEKRERRQRAWESEGGRSERKAQADSIYLRWDDVGRCRSTLR